MLELGIKSRCSPMSQASVWTRAQARLVVTGIAALVFFSAVVSGQHCLTGDCNPSEDIKTNGQKRDDSQLILGMMPNEEEAALLNQWSDIPFEYILKTSPELKSIADLSPGSAPLVPMMEKMAKKTKLNWIKKFRDFKRTEGNRNFQTQGWK